MENLQKKNNKSLKMFFASILVFSFLFLLNTSPASAACNFYSSMTTTNKNISNWTTTCTITGVDGIDNGTNDTSTTNTASLTLGNNGALTVNNGGTLVAGALTISGGSISIQAGGIVKTGSPVWITDGDSDGWVLNFNAASFSTSTSSSPVKRRLGLMKSYSTVDCNDGALHEGNICYSYSQGSYYGYGQGGYYRQSAYYSQSGYYRQSAYYSQSGYYRQGYYCFLKDTKILMADGSYKEIKDVKVGDEVLSYNTETKEMVKDTVSDVIVHNNILGQHLLVNGVLKVTPNHPLFINGEWKDAGTLKIGDVLVTPEGETTVNSIQISENVVNDLYNLHLQGSDHNYFAEDILVHNK